MKIPSSGRERRRDPRVESDVAAVVRIGGREVSGKLKNISRGGAAVVVPGDGVGAVGEAVSIEIGTPSASFHFALPGHLLLTRPVADSAPSATSLHIQFDDLATDQVKFLGALMRSLLPGQVTRGNPLAKGPTLSRDDFGDGDSEQFFLGLRQGDYGQINADLKPTPSKAPASGPRPAMIAALAGGIGFIAGFAVKAWLG